MRNTLICLARFATVGVIFFVVGLGNGVLLLDSDYLRGLIVPVFTPGGASHAPTNSSDVDAIPMHEVRELSNQFQGPEIVQVDYADDFFRFV
jgi:hypothetical protein